jgi:hypothetical protein
MTNMKNETSIDRMNLYEIVEFCTKNGWSQTAAYFTGCQKDSVVIDHHWIDKSFVSRHVGSEIMQRMECECITWMPYKK